MSIWVRVRLKWLLIPLFIFIGLVSYVSNSLRSEVAETPIVSPNPAEGPKEIIFGILEIPETIVVPSDWASPAESSRKIFLGNPLVVGDDVCLKLSASIREGEVYPRKGKIFGIVKKDGEEFLYDYLIFEGEEEKGYLWFLYSSNEWDCQQ